MGDDESDLPSFRPNKHSLALTESLDSRNSYDDNQLVTRIIEEEEKMGSWYRRNRLQSEDNNQTATLVEEDSDDPTLFKLDRTQSKRSKSLNPDINFAMKQLEKHVLIRPICLRAMDNIAKESHKK